MKKYIFPLLLSVFSFSAAAEIIEDEWYVGAVAGMVLPQGGSSMCHLGGAAIRGGYYLSDFFAVESEVGWMEDSASISAQSLWHWQDGELYGNLFGYSRFDPFFTFGAKGWIARDAGQVGPKLGMGAFYHLDDHLSIRVDFDATLGLDSEVEMVYTIVGGIQYSF